MGLAGSMAVRVAAAVISQLVEMTELQVGPRNFRYDIPTVFNKGHGLELDVDLEIRTVPTHERPLQRSRQSTFSCENRKQSLSGHTGRDCLHALQNWTTQAT